MALLATQTVIKTGAGITPTYAAAAGGGDTFNPGAHTFLHVKNGSGGVITVTVVTPGTVTDLAVADVAVAVPATTGDKMLGPFPPQHFADPTTGLVSVTYSGVTSLTVAVIDVP